MIMWICRWTYKMLDRLLDWLERVQWEMDVKRRENERKKKRKETAHIKKKIDNAKKVLIENGYTFERDWQDIEYKGNKYTPIMIEECSGFQKDSIIITARRNVQG